MGTIWISWEEAWRALASAPGTSLDRGPQGKESPGSSWAKELGSASLTGGALRLGLLTFEASVIAKITLHFILNKRPLSGSLLLGLRCFYCNLPALL